MAMKAPSARLSLQRSRGAVGATSPDGMCLRQHEATDDSALVPTPAAATPDERSPVTRREQQVLFELSTSADRLVESAHGQ